MYRRLLFETETSAGGTVKIEHRLSPWKILHVAWSGDAIIAIQNGL